MCLDEVNMAESNVEHHAGNKEKFFCDKQEFGRCISRTPLTELSGSSGGGKGSSFVYCKVSVPLILFQCFCSRYMYCT